jgi:hypothetical protein
VTAPRRPGPALAGRARAACPDWCAGGHGQEPHAHRDPGCPPWCTGHGEPSGDDCLHAGAVHVVTPAIVDRTTPADDQLVRAGLEKRRVSAAVSPMGQDAVVALYAAGNGGGGDVTLLAPEEAEQLAATLQRLGAEARLSAI